MTTSNDSNSELSPNATTHPDEMPFADFIWNQKQYPEAGWEAHTIGRDPVALAMLDALDHWRRNQDSEAAIELLERAIETARWYQGMPPARVLASPPAVTATSLPNGGK